MYRVLYIVHCIDFYMRKFGKFAIKGFARAVPVSLANSDQATLVFAHLQKGSRLANSYIERGVGEKL